LQQALHVGTPGYGVAGGDTPLQQVTAEHSQLEQQQACADNARVSAAPAPDPQCVMWATMAGAQQNTATGPAMAMMPLARNMGTATAPMPMMAMMMMAMPNQTNQTNTSEACPGLAPQSRSAKSGARSINLASRIASTSPGTEEFTTLMLRNLPNQYTRDMLVDMLISEGFAGRFSFVYLPIDFKTHAGLGYAFVDLVSPQDTENVRQHFEGFSRWAVRSEKIATVSWSHPEQQGLSAHVDRYRNSPVMHDCVPDSWKPALFSAGVRVPFPPPTKKLRNPHIRNL